MRLRTSVIALAIAAALPSVAAAVDFSYSGFSTAAYAQTDTDEAQVGYSGQPDGIDSDGSFEIDSKLGLQVTAKFNEMFSAVVQGVAYADLSGDWEPRLDWAYVRFRPLSSVSIRAGYLRTPTFMYSDSVFIGYANTWVRPPMEVYNMSAVYQMRGVDVTWRGRVGPLTVSVNPYYGDSEVDLESETLDVPEWMGIAATAEYNSFLVRVGYSEVELGSTTTALVPLIDALRAVPAAFCGACAAEADRLDLDGPVVKNFDVGVQYDDGVNFVATEYATTNSGGNYLVPDKTGAYATYGRHFGSIMPYATYAILRRDQGFHSDAIPATGALAGLNAGVNATISSGNQDQNSYSVGVRYEVPAFSVLNGALVKLQFDHIDAKHGNGMLNNVEPGFDGSLNMVSASFDFIF
jgi:hypothetical protein